jgi:hypothetical protein
MMNENIIQDGYWTYFDEAWKKVIETFFPHLIKFFLPKLYEDADLAKPPVFLDKEMEQLSKKSRKGAKYVDKLIKIHLKDGKEQWMLIHIEVQGYPDKEFSHRMFRYFYRIFDKHNKKIVSMAILTGFETSSLENRYELEAYGSHLLFEYPTFRIMDYDSEELERSDNPIALAVLISQEKERAERRGDKFNTKLRLIRLLYSKGYVKEDIIGLLEFLDWSLQVTEEEEVLIWEEIKKMEDDKMPYVTSWERIAIKEGIKEGALITGREMILELLEERFGSISYDILDIVNKIDDSAKLREYHRYAARCNSINEFKSLLNGNK